MRRALVLEVGAWWLVLTGLWCAFIGNITSIELICGVAAGLIAALAAGQLRWMDWPTFRPRLRWLRWIPVVIASAIADTVRLVLLVTRGRNRDPDGAGRFQTIPFGPSGDTRAARSHRAYATLALSATPGSYVVDTYPERGEARVHTLVEGAPDLTREVAG